MPNEKFYFTSEYRLNEINFRIERRIVLIRMHITD